MAKQHESLAAVGTLADWAAPAPPPPLSLDITNVMKSTRRRGAKSKVQRSEGTENAALAGNNAVCKSDKPSMSVRRVKAMDNCFHVLVFQWLQCNLDNASSPPQFATQ